MTAGPLVTLGQGHRRAWHSPTAALPLGVAVSGRPNISAGIAGANARGDRGEALPRRAGADCGSDGGRIIAKKFEAPATERGRYQGAAQGGSGKGGVAGAAADEDADDRELDRRTPGVDSPGYLNHLLYRQRKSGRKKYQDPTPLPLTAPLPRVTAPHQLRCGL